MQDLLNFPYTVEELVLMGRAKHINVFSTPKKEDYDIVNETLEELKISNVSLLMKKGERCFGNTQELLMQKNMKTYFDMETKLIELDTDEGTKKSLVVL